MCKESIRPFLTDNEMRRINHSVAAVHSRSSIQLRRGGRPMQSIERLGEEEISYLGFVNMDLVWLKGKSTLDGRYWLQRRAKGLLHDFPPPIEFWTHLEPMEKVGFLYYTSLHRYVSLLTSSSIINWISGRIIHWRPNSRMYSNRDSSISSCHVVCLHWKRWRRYRERERSMKGEGEGMIEGVLWDERCLYCKDGIE